MSVDKDLVSVQQARDLVEAAHRAQVQLARFDQAKVDAICEAMARAALKESARLGAMAVEETGFGVADDKREKNRFASEDVWNAFRNLRTVGVVSESKDVVEIASPRGVVAGVIPSTNPTSTAIFKILIAVKSRNAIVLSPHPSAAKCINETARVMREAGVKEGLPADAVGCMTSATIEGTEALMKHKQTALILATGGIGLVRAAYSSGKPAFGVGPGNVPVFVERTADVGVAVQNILTGKTFDNGTICASEQAVVADSPVARQVREEFARQGGHWLSAAEADNLAKVVATPQRGLNPAIVGRSVEVIAKMAGLSVPQGTRCLMVDVGGVGREHPLSMEKLSPILAFYVEDGVERAAARCFEILSYGGMGHTAGVHTRSREIAVAYGREMPASRVVVNTPTTHGAIGFSTALPPSMTLGCGSWGGNVTSDNISPLHLMDIKRVAFETRAVASKRPARAGEASQVASVRMNAPAPPQQQPAVAAQGGRINREEVAAIVDRFLAGRGAEQQQQQGAPALHTELHASSSPPPAQPVNEISPNWMDAKSSAAPHAEAAPTAREDNGGGNGRAAQPPSANAPAQSKPPAPGGGAQSPTNGHKAVDFVSEDDVRRAVQRGEKIYVNAKTIITPSARDIGDPAEVFAKI
ncbi:MAG: aldehyde dehydrogenase family protein [Acidobacteria bacterium]|nr:aldehyde dehydrogenase family protein [Acidobacteriota bacterium]MCA1643776.1 aldehyde dehydrogenase family protein [Acidobacteriota bacterium]